MAGSATAAIKLGKFIPAGGAPLEMGKAFAAGMPIGAMILIPFVGVGGTNP